MRAGTALKATLEATLEAALKPHRHHALTRQVSGTCLPETARQRRSSL